jgi:hypothetical protein
MKRFLALLAFVLSSPSADLAQTSRQIQTVRNEHLSHWGYSTVSWNPSWQPISVVQSTEMEQQLSRNAEDDETRVRLLMYYFYNDQRQQRVDSVCWLIEHHPDSPLLGLDIVWIFPSSMMAVEHYKKAMNNIADYQRVYGLWETAVALNPNEPEVLHNAARFFWNDPADRVKSLELAKRLQQIDPVNHSKVLTSFFARPGNNR